MAMQAMRTPDHRFEALPGYPFEPHYTEIDDGDGGTLRVHHAEAGPPGGEVVLCFHGELAWSYLYRGVLLRLAAAGYRAVAPDLVGFGRSDKPAARDDYGCRRHLAWLTAWLDALRLTPARLLAHDLGVLLGLRLLAEEPERFEAVVISNGYLPTGEEPISDDFRRWRDYGRHHPSFDVGAIVARTLRRPVPPEILAAYGAPFPEDADTAGVRTLAGLVPTSPDDPEAAANRQAWEVLRRWDRPFLTVFSGSAPHTRGLDAVFQRRIPGAAGQPHTTLENAGHFLQEDQPEPYSDAVIDFLRRAAREAGARHAS